MSRALEPSRTSPRYNTPILGVPEGKEKKGLEVFIEEKKKMAPNFPNLMKDINLQIQEDHPIPRMVRETHTKHVLIKLLKDKERILKATRGKRHITYKVFSIGLQASFTSENLGG